MQRSVIQGYVPTAESADKEIHNNLYKTLEETMAEISRGDVTIIVGFWDTKVVKSNIGLERVMGRHGYGNRMKDGRNCWNWQ